MTNNFKIRDKVKRIWEQLLNKIEFQRLRKRRSHHALKKPALIACPECGEMVRSHVVCPHCGYYNKKQVKEIKAKAGAADGDK